MLSLFNSVQIVMGRGTEDRIGGNCRFRRFVTFPFPFLFDHMIVNRTFLSTVAIVDHIFVLRNICLFPTQDA